MKGQNKIDISTLSNQIQSDFTPKSSENRKNKYKYNSYLYNNFQDKSNIINDNKNYKYIQSNNDNNIITETSKIYLIKNPPNLLKLCTNDDNDEYLRIHNENIKLSSELTLEKSKVIKLNNLLKDKEKENKDLKIKIEELEKNYEELEKDQKKYFEDKINSIYRGVSLDKNNLKETYDAIQRCKDKELSEINKEINNLYNIINLFFNFYNKKRNLLIKTGIISGKKNSIVLEDKYNNNHKNSLYIINSLDELINKLFNDNKELYDELVNYKDFCKKNEITEENEKIDEQIKKKDKNKNYEKYDRNNEDDIDNDNNNDNCNDNYNDNYNNIEENKKFNKHYNTEKKNKNNNFFYKNKSIDIKEGKYNIISSY